MLRKRRLMRQITALSLGTDASSYDEVEVIYKGTTTDKIGYAVPTPVATLDVTLGVYDPGDTGAANYQDSDTSDNIDVLKIVAPTEAATTDFTFKLIDNDTSSPLQAKDLGWSDCVKQSDGHFNVTEAALDAQINSFEPWVLDASSYDEVEVIYKGTTTDKIGYAVTVSSGSTLDVTLGVL